MLTWTERQPTPGDRRAWRIDRGDPDPHAITARYPERRLHRVQMTDLEEHWGLDAAIVGSGLRLIEVIRDDGRGGHVWFEEVPGWLEPSSTPGTPAATSSPPAKRSHHRRARP